MLHSTRNFWINNYKLLIPSDSTSLMMLLLIVSLSIVYVYIVCKVLPVMIRNIVRVAVSHYYLVANISSFTKKEKNEAKLLCKRVTYPGIKDFFFSAFFTMIGMLGIILMIFNYMKMNMGGM